MPSMYGDTLQALERAHLFRLIVWGAASVLAGTAVFAWLRVGARESSLVRQFAIMSAAWGVLDLIIALVLLPQLSIRDVAGATRLDRVLWLNIGLDAGYVLVGLTLAGVGWKVGRRFGLIGAGIAVIVQGLALALLDLVLAAQISR